MYHPRFEQLREPILYENPFNNLGHDLDEQYMRDTHHQRDLNNRNDHEHDIPDTENLCWCGPVLSFMAQIFGLLLVFITKEFLLVRYQLFKAMSTLNICKDQDNEDIEQTHIMCTYYGW